MRPLKLLYSAYACEPGRGSEPGVGWRWALESARIGHDVWVLTREANRPAIEAGWRAAGEPANLNFLYHDLPPWARWWKRGARGIYLYYLLWQWSAYRAVRRVAAAGSIDAVHHITFGVVRQPSFMGRLGIPFVIGPLGGGERAPYALRRHFSPLRWLNDAWRDLANALARSDPLVRQMLRAADAILVKTPESFGWLPPTVRTKASCELEIGVDLPSSGHRMPGTAAGRERNVRLLYVGRFLYWKGMGLGLRALAMARQSGARVTLTLIGGGPERRAWEALVHRLGLGGAVTWIRWLPQQVLLETYRNFDALLFPSLHDSSGNVVLEALASGLPVVCLGLGGPSRIVDASCGRVIDVASLSEAQVVHHLAAAVSELARDRHLLETLRSGARRRAESMQWRQVVGRVWGQGGIGYDVLAGPAGSRSRRGSRSISLES